MSSSILNRLTGIILCLQQGLSNAAPRIKMPVSLHRLISRRLLRLQSRLRRLITRGPRPSRPPRATPRNTPQATVEHPASPRPVETCYPPSNFAWLLRMLPGTEVPCARSWLSILLDEAETQSLIATHPTLARSLRALCHMVGLKPPPCLKLPPRPRAKRASSAASKPARTPARTPAKPPRTVRRIWRPAPPVVLTPAQARLAFAQFLNPHHFST